MCTSAAHVLKIGCNETETTDLNDKIHRFWDLDEIGISNQELSVYEKFKNNITLQEGRYSVRLPIKEYHPVLPDNYPILPDNYDLSLKRLQSLKMRLAKDEMLLQKYDQIFQDQINAGMIKEVKTEGLVGNVTYLPHKEVLRNESTTTKVRIVFDPSVKLKNKVSLNDILYTGPCLNLELYKLLLQFRIYPTAITADLEKAYLKINVEKKDREYVRLLWFKNLGRGGLEPRYEL